MAYPTEAPGRFDFKLVHQSGGHSPIGGQGFIPPSCLRLGDHQHHPEVVSEGVDQNEFEQLGDGLSHREIEVLQLLARGKSNKQIGTDLDISANTAANHVGNILAKTGAANRTQAAMMATDWGMVDST